MRDWLLLSWHHQVLVHVLSRVLYNYFSVLVGGHLIFTDHLHLIKNETDYMLEVMDEK